MAILHTPRTLASIARGMIKRHRRLAVVATNHDRSSTGGTASASNSSATHHLVGFGNNGKGNTKNPKKDSTAHVYKSRPSVLWDVDYLGHMNNASYLTHAEYARWEWIAENGALKSMYNTGINFVVTQSAVRFRKEIKLSQSFEIHSFLHAIDDRHLWMQQTFRSCINKKDDNTSIVSKEEKEGRILAQVLIQAAAVQNYKIVPPTTMLEVIGVPEDITNSLLWKGETIINNDNEKDEDGMLLSQRFKELDETFRKEATADDKRLLQTK